MVSRILFFFHDACKTGGSLYTVYGELACLPAAGECACFFLSGDDEPRKMQSWRSESKFSNSSPNCPQRVDVAVADADAMMKFYC